MQCENDGHGQAMAETAHTRESEKKCYAAALRLLARRDHSRKELLQKLKTRGFSTAQIEWAFDRCQRYDYLDDERFASNYARHRQRRGYGIRSIRQSLLTKGVDRDIAAKVIERHCTRQLQLEQCYKVLRKKLKVGKDVRSLKPKLYRHLLGRGFSPAIAAAALESAMANGSQ